MTKLDMPHVVTKKVKKQGGEEVAFEVQGIAREKIVFALRPVPLIESRPSGRGQPKISS
ncbi:MAG: hypothetical protein P4M11_14495 [Candidatus Pacebacteria bacterium]|nr:hypothetical protein [Candidatus Paceibacterota bacterium]